MIIDINDETNQLEQNQLELLEKLLDYAREKEEIENDAELSITIVDNETIQEINKQYRDKDQPTDVISFALENTGRKKLRSGEIIYLGILVISSFPLKRSMNKQMNMVIHSIGN